jgi:hypothetical protein
VIPASFASSSFSCSVGYGFSEWAENQRFNVSTASHEKFRNCSTSHEVKTGHPLSDFILEGFNLFCCDAAHDGSAVAALVAKVFTAYHFRRPSLTHLHNHHLHHYRWMQRDTGA